jgi:hypothetical protein
MKKSGDGDILQIVILTLFMVSGLLFVASLWFASQRDEALALAQAAVSENTMLQAGLLDEQLRKNLSEEFRLKTTDAGRKEFGAEINERAQNELRVTRTTAPVPKPVESYTKWTKRLDAPIKEFGHELRFWMSFLARIENERPDIHVETVTLTATDFDIVAGGEPRKWGMSASFVYWEQKGEAAASGPNTKAPKSRRLPPSPFTRCVLPTSLELGLRS